MVEGLECEAKAPVFIYKQYIFEEVMIEALFQALLYKMAVWEDVGIGRTSRGLAEI